MPVASSSSFPIPAKVDLDFAPSTYVADWCALAAGVQNVTGEWRRVRMLAQRPRRGPASAWPDALVHDILDVDAREAHVAADPMSRISGEYLPRYLPGELEIARIVLGTTPQVVCSLRARADLPGRRAHFGRVSHLAGEEQRALRLADEQGTDFELERSQWSGTCTLRSLIRLIDGVRASMLPDQPEHMPFPEALALEATMLRMPNEQLPEFVQISSVVYPELRSFYRARLAWWLRRHFKVVAANNKRGEDRLADWWAERRT